MLPPADRTLTRLARRAVELDVATAEAADAVCREWPALLDVALTSDDLVGWLVQLEVAVSLPTDDVDDLEAAYRESLEAMAACTRGRCVVTDVALDGVELSFRLGPTLHERTVDSSGEEYLDTLTLFEDLSLFVDPERDPARWMELVVDGEPVPDVFLLAVPAALRTLAQEFGGDAAVMT